MPNLDERGPLRAVYAVARMKDAERVFVVLGRQEVEKVRKASKAGDSGPWVSWEEEMWKKTAIRRLCKYLPLSPEMQRAISLDEQADAGVAQSLADGIINLPEIGEEEVIEVAATEPEKAPEQKAALQCPKPGADGLPRYINSGECEQCAERKGCPAHSD